MLRYIIFTFYTSYPTQQYRLLTNPKYPQLLSYVFLNIRTFYYFVLRKNSSSQIYTLSLYAGVEDEKSAHAIVLL